jgi:hypothetical protein
VGYADQPHMHREVRELAGLPGCMPAMASSVSNDMVLPPGSFHCDVWLVRVRNGQAQQPVEVQRSVQVTSEDLKHGRRQANVHGRHRRSARPVLS